MESESDFGLEDAVRIADDYLSLVPVAVGLMAGGRGAVLLCRNGHRPVFPASPYSTHLVFERGSESGHYDLSEESGWASFEERWAQYRA